MLRLEVMISETLISYHFRFRSTGGASSVIWETSDWLEKTMWITL